MFVTSARRNRDDSGRRKAWAGVRRLAGIGGASLMWFASRREGKR